MFLMQHQQDERKSMFVSVQEEEEDANADSDKHG